MSYKFLILSLAVIICFAIVAKAQFGEDGGYGDGDSYGGMGGMGGMGGDSYGGGGGGGNSAKEMSSSAEIKDFLAEVDSEPAVVGYFDAESNSDDKGTFESLSSTMGSNYRFAFTTDKSVLEEAKIDGNAVYVYKPAKFVVDKDEKQKARYPSKSLKRESLEKFIADKSLPLVGEKTFKNADVYDGLKVPVLTVFAEVDHKKNPKGFTYLVNRVKKAAKAAKGKMVFNIASKNDYSYVLSDYGLDLSEKSDVGVGIKVGNMYYKMSGKFSADSVDKFVADFKASKIVGKEKVADSHSGHDHDEGDHDDSSPSDVVTVTDSNVSQVLGDPDKDVMIEFYAPWCGHCKALKPKYKKLAANLKDDTGVTIAEMDATAAKVPAGFEVSGYPTIMWVPKGDKKNPIPYDGEREVAAMEEWIKAHKSK